MTRDTEKVFMAFGKYIEENNIDLNEENKQEILNQFISVYNEELKNKKEGKVALNDSEKAKQYYDMAMDSNDVAYCKRMLKKAIKLDPKFIDAHSELASYIENDDVRFKEYRKIEEMALKFLAENDITKEKNQGVFYEIYETRPYLRLKERIMNEYGGMHCYSLAIKEGEEIIALNENDNLGVRFSLLAMYTILEKKEKAESLCEKYPENAIPTHLFLAVLYYKFRDKKKSINHLKAIKKIVPEVHKIIEGDVEDVVANKMEGYYRPFSMEEVMLFMMMYSELFTEDVLELFDEGWK